MSDLAYDRTWRRAYRALAEVLVERAPSARPLLTGFAVCVDKRIDLHVVAPPLAEIRETGARHFFAELMARAGAGRGGEILVDWPGGPAFLDTFAGPRDAAIGGTSAQAAWTLSRLGAPVVLALSDRSAEILALLDPSIRLAGPDGEAIPVGEVAAQGVGRPAHYILEYAAGRPLPGVTPPRSTRVIVRFADEDIERDSAFRAFSRRHSAGARTALLSSPNTVPPGQFEGALDELAEAVGEWRAAGVGLVHLELGEYPWPGTRDATLARLGGIVTSIGLNLNELRSLAAAPGTTEAQALALAEQVGVTRLVVHADDWALAVTQGDAQIELEAIATGCLLASARAAAGAPVAEPHIPEEAVFSPPPAPPLTRCGGWSVVCCPAPHLTHPASTVGLGDTFAAGFLLAHSLASPLGVFAGMAKAGTSLADAGCALIPSK
ncbi:ADP-dependent glucokinase/phosphofructokinase [Methylovirgula sp. 4M-Z18]|uniref:ADP-dependent glucokinase/phosphofructokinase n=1 Tax=Methylovirgula sp. 4M-Z18 TaxID=2293567 RepID=UPI000E2F1D7F|nr:ADP-dependent glucokinase/phosphofructokinase [Methylovirgula sp. 4M-Z18]RFB76507.1 hypothetical protein DYH55_20445 [Methylovirgula sp. 4M-Z18]